MDTPLVRFELPNGRLCDARPGDIIGRMAGAAVRLNDPRVSEAHALVSLRGRKLKLLALRGGLKLAHERVPISELTLSAEQQIALARDVFLRVVEVELPTHILAVSGLDSGPQDLASSVYSILPGGELSPRYTPTASVHLWSTSEGWYLREGDLEPRSVTVGDTWSFDDREFELIERSIDEAGVQPTIFRGRIHEPLTIVATYTTVHIQREGHQPVLLSGFPARILSELIAFDGPVSWEVIARELWRSETNRRLLRQNWDRHLSTLRSKLRRAGIRKGLVRSDGRGHIELVMHSGDAVEDRT